MAKEDIVIFPFMARGHLIPFLALTNHIEQRNRNLIINLVNTPRNVQTLQSILPTDSTIRLHTLPFSPSDHGLPFGAESAESIPARDLTSLFLASQSLRPDFLRLVADLTEQHGRPPICIIADYFLGWTVEVARSLGISHATFTTSGAYGTACYMSMWLHLPHTRTSSPEFHLPGFPEEFRLHLSQLPAPMRAATSTDPKAVFMQKQLPLSLFKTDAVLCNTVEELEVFGLQMLRRNTGVKVWSVGPLDAGSLLNRTRKKFGSTEADFYLQWLDLHPPGSVIYISFGSQNTISASQMMALASGLEASGAPFVWAIRPPVGFEVAGEFEDEWLPEGFEGRMRDKRKGLLVKGWVPQVEILSHKSTGAFLSHCGWNSVIESLTLGLPIIGWPLAADHPFISKMLEEELGVGVVVAWGSEDEVESEKVESMIKLVAAGEKGKEMKKKAMEFSEKLKAAMREDAQEKGSSLKSLDGFIETLNIQE